MLMKREKFQSVVTIIDWKFFFFLNAQVWLQLKTIAENFLS